jgi:hypothetical protein
MTIGIPALTVILTSLDTRRNFQRIGDKSDRLETSLAVELRSLSMDMIAFRKEMRDDMALFHKFMANPGTEL